MSNSNACTALIVHPLFPRPYRRLAWDGSLLRLESDGPDPEFEDPTRHFAGIYAAACLCEREDIPQRLQRAPKQRDPHYIGEQSMRRVLGLIDSLIPSDKRTARAITEMRARILTVHPHCLNYLP